MCGAHRGFRSAGTALPASSFTSTAAPCAASKDILMKNPLATPLALAVGIALSIASPWSLAASDTSSDSAALAALRSQVAELPRRPDHLAHTADRPKAAAQAPPDTPAPAEPRHPNTEQPHHN